MYNIIADMHTHTIASDHAFSTLKENIIEAKQLGLFAIAATDHAPALSDAPHEWHAPSVASVFPDYIHGLRVYRGTEANVKDYDGSLDLPQGLLYKLEWVIASFHTPVCAPAEADKITNAWLNILKNPGVDILGHSGQEEYRYDYERVIKEAAHSGKIVEINNHSFEVRSGSAENCREIALLCKKYGVRICVNSDAHIDIQIGRFPFALEMLEDIAFPSELIINADRQRLEDYIIERKSRVSAAKNR